MNSMGRLTRDCIAREARPGLWAGGQLVSGKEVLNT